MAKDKAKEPDKAKLPAKGKDVKDGKQQKAVAKVAKRKGRIGMLLERLGKYFREMYAELKKATWPSRKDLVKYTGIVLAFVTILAAIVGLLDFGFTNLLKLITG
jgi:preprotein translocase subunit SecE